MNLNLFSQTFYFLYFQKIEIMNKVFYLNKKWGLSAIQKNSKYMKHKEAWRDFESYVLSRTNYSSIKY